MSTSVFSHQGYCPICDAPATFTAEHAWFRDHLLCSGCGSIPRERALFKVIAEHYPNYSALAIHESSPCGRGASIRLHKDCERYSMSHYFPDIQPGEIDPRTGHRCEDLERLTFADQSFDLFITQDVMEHVFAPDAVFAEIARVLRPGGAHIFTVPLVNKAKGSERRASRDGSGHVNFDKPAQYHGNPVDPSGSLVTMDWGYDIAAYIMQVASMPSAIVVIDNIDLGIRAEYIDVLVSWKLGEPRYLPGTAS